MQRLSTRSVPARERIPFLQDFVGRHVVGLQFTPVEPECFEFELEAFDLADRVIMGRAHYMPVQGARNRQMLQDGRDDFLLTIHEHEHEVAIEGAAPTKVEAGDIMLIDQGARSEFKLPSTSMAAVSLGRAQLSRLVPGLERHASYHMPLRAGGAAMFAGYASLLHRHPPQNDDARALAARHIYELVALAINGVAGQRRAPVEHGIRAARLALVKDYIRERLTDVELSVEGVALGQGISPRYVHRLFEAEGVTFSSFLRDMRLDLVYRQLKTGGGARASISTLAFDAGFSDLSNFNRAFKKRFDMTPSELRAMTIKRG